MASGAVKPVITWADSQFTVRSGISWVTLAKNSQPEERLRFAGREELLGFTSLLIDGVAAIADGAAFELEHEIGSHQIRFKWQDSRSRPEINENGKIFCVPSLNVMGELIDWLVFVTGGCRAHSSSAPLRLAMDSNRPLLHFIPENGNVNFALSASPDELFELQQKLLAAVSAPQVNKKPATGCEMSIDGATLAFLPQANNSFIVGLTLDGRLAKLSDVTRPMLAKLALQIDQVMEGSDA